MEEDAFDVSLERISVLLINYMPTAVFGFMLIIGYRVFYVKKDSDDASARSNINRGRRHSAINKQAEEAGNCNCILKKRKGQKCVDYCDIAQPSHLRNVSLHLADIALCRNWQHAKAL